MNTKKRKLESVNWVVKQKDNGVFKPTYMTATTRTRGLMHLDWFRATDKNTLYKLFRVSKFRVKK